MSSCGTVGSAMETTTMKSLSIILPAKNEASSLVKVLPNLRKHYPEAEIIVVNDGSDDNTSEVCERSGVVEVRHPYSLGNGAAIKSGARKASGEVLVFMDADGQHRPEDIEQLLDSLNSGYDMVVGARVRKAQASVGRLFANSFYNVFSSWMVGKKISDLTSGFRAVYAKKFREFLYLLPNGFSYPTTITMAFFRAGYSVNYINVDVASREGKSHIRPLKDGVRFLLIIFKVGTLYSPLKIFLPISLSFLLVAVGYYGYTYFMFNRFTNMSALLFSTSTIIFLIGLVSEQITALLYNRKD